MKIFLSWSGEESRKLAAVFRDWIATVIQSAEPWMSEEDIRKGQRWSSELTQRLAEDGYGIIFVTPMNLERPWLMFEAGALAKSLENRVSPLLFGLNKSDLANNPLNMFQATDFTKAEVKRLAQSIASTEASRISEQVIDQSVEAFWEKLKGPCASIIKDMSSEPKHRRVKSLDDSEAIKLIADVVVQLQGKVAKLDSQQGAFLRERAIEFHRRDLDKARSAISQTQEMLNACTEAERQIRLILAESENPALSNAAVLLKGQLAEIRTASMRLFDCVHELCRGAVGPHETL